MADCRACNHTCCPHLYHGLLMMVVPEGHVVLKCCHCERMWTEHRCKKGCGHEPGEFYRESSLVV